jgi:hypothetical protein
MKRVSAVMFGIVLALTALNSPHATTYTFTLLNSGYTCLGINNAGTIVGYYLNGKGYHGFSEAGDVYTTVDGPDYGGDTRANGINNNGTIVGPYADSKGHGHIFSLTNGVYTTVEGYPNASSGVSGVNNAGTLVGVYADHSGNWQGYSLNGTTYTYIQYPDAFSTVPRGINDAGVIVGSYTDVSSNTHGFSLINGTYASIDYPGAISTDASGINKDGTIVGSYTISATEGSHGFSMNTSGVYTPIDHPGASQGWGMGTEVRGINDEGAIIGLVNGDSPFLGTPDGGSTLTLTLIKSGKGTGSVTSDPSGIDCGSACSASFEKSSTVTLTAQAADEYSQFSKWSGCTTSSGNECSVVMTAKKKVTATFTPSPTYQLTVSQGHTNGGKGTVTSDDLKINCGTDCKEKYLKGTAITLTAVAQTGSVFKGWKPATSCTTTDPCAVTMDKAKAVQAVFVGDYTLKVVSKSQKVKKVSGTGNVTYAPASIDCATGSTSNCSGKVPYHTSVTLIAAPDTGSALKGWSGCPSPSGLTCTLTMDKPFNITATFKPETK